MEHSGNWIGAMAGKIIILYFLTAIFCQGYCYADEKVENYLDLAVLFKENGEYQKAIDVLESAARRINDDRLKRYLGRCYYLNGDIDIAVEVIADIEHKTWHDYFYLGAGYQGLNKEDLAYAFYADSVNAKRNSMALYRCAKIHFRRRDYKTAIKDFKDVLSLDSSIRLAYYYLAFSYLAVDNFEQAYQNFSKAANFYPKNNKIKENLSRLEEKLGRDFFAKEEEKKKTIRKMVELPAYKREEGIPLIKVAIARGVKKITFKNNGEFTVRDKNKVFPGQKNKLYTMVLQDKLVLYNDETKSICDGFSGAVKVCGVNFPFYIIDVEYGEGNFWHKKVDTAYRGDLEFRINNGKISVINLIGIEEYLYGVLPAEIPVSSKPAALKAQAVAARTVVFKNLGRHKKEGFDLCADVHCQVYKGMTAETPQTTQSVKQTRGEILVYNGNPIEAFYHANCGGCLRSDSFGQREYLTCKIDAGRFECPQEKQGAFAEEEWFYNGGETFCESEKASFRWQRIYDEEDFEIAFGFPMKELKYIMLLDKGDCYHYNKVALAAPDKMILDSGLKIRSYFDSLRSSAFKLEERFLQGRRKEIIFWGAGFGHGAGLCQEGAIKQADNGRSYKDILQHYYPNTQVKASY